MLKNKKAQDVITGNIMFIILNVLYFAILIIFLSQYGSGTGNLEKLYVRQIAMALDNAQPGTETSIYLPDMFDKAAKDGYKNSTINVDYIGGIITVKLSGRSGASYYFFNKLKDGSISINTKLQTVIIKP